MTGTVLASLGSMPPPVVVEYLLVGGGGGGGISFRAAAGGGGGGEGQNANVIVAPGDTWTITVGAGGTAWNYFSPYSCPLNAPVYAFPSEGGVSCIAPLNIVALGGNYGGGNCIYGVSSPFFPQIWCGKQPSTPPFGAGVGGGGSICQSAPLATSNRFPGRTLGSSGSGGGGCGANNNPPLYPPTTITPIFGLGTSPLGGCWRVGGGGGGGSIPPAPGTPGTTGLFTGGTPSNNLLLCAGAGGDGFTIPWAGTFGGGGGGGVKNNIRPGSPSGAPPLSRAFDNRICDNSGPGGTGGGGVGPREDFGPASFGYGMTQATVNGPQRFGQPNTGGGASGSGSTCASPPNATVQDMQVGAFGGSGVAYVRYPANYRLAVTTGNPTITVESGYIVYKFTGSGTIQF